MPSKSHQSRRPDHQAQRAIAALLGWTVIVALGVVLMPGLDTTTRSVILIGWMGIMIAVLRRAR